MNSLCGSNFNVIKSTKQQCKRQKQSADDLDNLENLVMMSPTKHRITAEFSLNI